MGSDILHGSPVLADFGGYTGHAIERRPLSWKPQAVTLRTRAFAYLLALDIMCLVAGFAITAYLRGVFLGVTDWVIVVVALVPIYFLSAVSLHAYKIEGIRHARHAAIRGGQALLLSIGMILLIAFCLRASESFSRTVITVGTITTFGMIFAARYLFVQNMAKVIGGNPFSVMLLHDGHVAVPKGDFSIVLTAEGSFDPERHDPIMYDRLARTVAGVDRVIVACAPERRAAWAHALKGINVQGEIFVPELASLAPLGASMIDDMPTVIVAAGPLGLFERVVKRAFDIVVAGSALVLLSPIIAMIALLIKLDSPGPALFRQVRIGCKNEMFWILKFRSMRTDDSDGAGHRSTSRDDDRITRVGRFIRKASLDELPQLFNVLKGDMSIVGPRPHALGSRAAEKLFWEVDGRYWHRHAVKPGLTGLAQIRGYRGATVREDDLKNRLQADLEYLENWSIWRDIKIIFLTIRVILHPNAY